MLAYLLGVAAAAFVVAVTARLFGAVGLVVVFFVSLFIAKVAVFVGG
jgi:hypothetical protein